MADYSELRRLLAEWRTMGPLRAGWIREMSGTYQHLSRAAVNALPGLLDENDRLRLAGIKNSLEMSAQEERIAQLEAAIQELIEGGSMDEKDMLFAYGALESKEPTKP